MASGRQYGHWTTSKAFVEGGNFVNIKKKLINTLRLYKILTVTSFGFFFSQNIQNIRVCKSDLYQDSIENTFSEYGSHKNGEGQFAFHVATHRQMEYLQ